MQRQGWGIRGAAVTMHRSLLLISLLTLVSAAKGCARPAIMPVKLNDNPATVSSPQKPYTPRLLQSSKVKKLPAPRAILP
jgi:hypothetical protein